MGSAIKRLLGVLFLICFLIMTACAKTENETPVTKTEFALDTVCSITVYDQSDAKIIDLCFQKINELENKMSSGLPDSEVSNINKNAGIKAVRVSEDTYKVIKAGKKYAELTGGKFDITVGPLVKLWGINTSSENIPSVRDIKSAVDLIDYRNIVLNDGEKSVMLGKKGMAIDLGGIAKGYIADAVAGILEKNNVKHAIVDLGGNIVAVGSKPNGTDWKIGLQTPFEPRGEAYGIVGVSGKAVVTSGIYERYFEKNGRIYHHIMDTTTGYPIDNGLVAVTVICASSTDADALAKVFALGLEDGIDLIERQSDAEAVFVTDKFEVYVTSGLKNIKITDSRFKLSHLRQ